MSSEMATRVSSVRSDQVACTIIARNYLSLARTLFRSMRAVMPETRCYALVIDSGGHRSDAQPEDFRVVDAGSLGFAAFNSHAFKYDVIELATALKPLFLEHLIRRERAHRLIYLDPDTYVLAPCDEVYSLLERYDFVLTPHRLSDEGDGTWAIDSSLLTGVFNLGFLGINSSTNALALLRWWQRKVFDDCVMDFSRGLFLDQKFMDMSTTLFENGHVLKDPTYNIATWNADERPLAYADGMLACAGAPLHVVHFSGYRPSGASLTEHETPLPADDPAWWFPADDPGWKALTDMYREALMANGFATTRKLPYGHERFVSGLRRPIHKRVRTLYLRSKEWQDKERDPFRSVFLQGMSLWDDAITLPVTAWSRCAQMIHRLHRAMRRLR
jgi:hypothetical protein